MKLTLGKMTSKQLAQWFGVLPSTYSHNISNYLNKLEDYCEFEKIYGGVVISEIYIEEYDKGLKLKDEKIYLEEIKDCVEIQDGLSTLSGMVRKMERDNPTQKSLKNTTRRMSKAGTKLFGDPTVVGKPGKVGSREYIWAIKLNDYNGYRLMTEEEEKLFDDIISKCYTLPPEKIKKKELLKDQLKQNEIDVQQYFELEELYGLNTFKDCIFKFKEQTGHMIVRCTKHELMESYSFNEEEE